MCKSAFWLREDCDNTVSFEHFALKDNKIVGVHTCFRYRTWPNYIEPDFAYDALGDKFLYRHYNFDRGYESELADHYNGNFKYSAVTGSESYSNRKTI